MLHFIYCKKINIISFLVFYLTTNSVFACSVCYDASNTQALKAYYGMTILLILLPLTIAVWVGRWVYREFIKGDLREDSSVLNKSLLSSKSDFAISSNQL